MKKLLIIIVFLSLITITAMAKLSDETLKTVEDLRWKHGSYGQTLFSIEVNDDTWGTASVNSIFDYEWWSMTFKDGKLFIETQDGKWFIEMEKVKEGKEAINE